jgi:hypothetical protein
MSPRLDYSTTLPNLASRKYKIHFWSIEIKLYKNPFGKQSRGDSQP